MTTARIVSVNVGIPRTTTWAGRAVTSAIWKGPVAGRIAVAGVNLAGDDQADRRVHGGPDKAVYAYAAEDYAWWSEELGADIPFATFGENLTTAGIDLGACVIGTRWQVGSAVLEVAQPRQPCFKLGMRMGDAQFVDRFDEARRPGAYLRIIEAGDVGAGDTITADASPAHGFTILDLTDTARARRAGGGAGTDRVDRGHPRRLARMGAPAAGAARLALTALRVTVPPNAALRRHPRRLRHRREPRDRQGVRDQPGRRRVRRRVHRPLAAGGRGTRTLVDGAQE